MTAASRLVSPQDSQEDAAFCPVDVWQRIQALRLRAHLEQATKSPLYASLRLDASSPLDVASLEAALAELPLTSKDQLAAAGRNAFAAPAKEFREWVCTSGTSGKPLDIPLTQADLERLTQNEAAALAIAGVGADGRAGDLFVLASAMDRMFVAGLAYWLGAQRLNATCLRAGPHMAADLLTRLPTAPVGQKVFVITVPSILVQDAQAVLANGARRPDAIIAIGEPIRSADLSYNALGKRLSERFKCPVLSTYANTETCTSFAESPLCRGGHLNPHLAIVEIVDEHDRLVSTGTVGEVVITPLGAHALPLLRFKTGDIAALYTEPCACGRTTPRLGPILGRRQQLLKLRGASVYPNTITEALREFPEIADSLQVADRDELGCDRLALHMVLTSDTQAIRRAIEMQLRGLLRVLPAVHYTTAAVLAELRSARPSRKPVAFIDQR